VLLSDDALWAYSEQSGGPIDPSLFSITLPQRTVQRTVRQLLDSLKLTTEQQGNGSHPDVNWGKNLPLGTSMVTLLQNLVKEEEELVNATTSSNVPMAGEEKEREKPVSKRSRREKGLASNPGSMSNDEFLQSNALIKILLKIPPSEVRRLRENAYAVSHYYRFYDFNLSLSHSAPPLTAMYTFPSGGGMEMVDRYLTHRKKAGIDAVWTQCQVNFSASLSLFFSTDLLIGVLAFLG
jgi:hypothetical protein